MNQLDPNFAYSSELLKQSLSEALTHFYPFAGKAKDSLSVDCNDGGALYIESNIVSCTLSQFLSQPDFLDFLDKFFPKEANWKKVAPGSHVLMVQKSNFTCGGFAIGVLLSHRVADATSCSSFMECWAAFARKSSVTEAVLPNFHVASMFPQREPYPSFTKLGSWFARTGNVGIRRFVFDGSAVESLKAKISSSSSSKLEANPNPTRVEAVSALLWKCITAGFDVYRPTILSHIVNLRRRAVPAFPKCSLGNFICLALGECTADERGDLGSLVGWLRKTLAKVDDKFVRNLQADGDGGLLELRALFEEINGTMSAVASSGGEILTISSWRNFGLYDIDFGLGKPVWTSIVGFNRSEVHFAPKIFIMDTRNGKGIEAPVTLGEDDMATLEHNEELPQFASKDPSPL